ncbi:MAG: hypothetical protein GX930_01180 [Clostridia bacterium]|nr:hypothetical protein [Clostridia bacterium]
MMEFFANEVPIVGAVMFLVWVGNQAGLPRKFSPLVATILSIGVAWFYLFPGDIPQAIMQGIIIASSAVGFHSGTKNMVEYVKSNNKN